MVIAFCSQKGGSGRTSTSIACAVEWQQRRRKVLLVDCDPQRSALTWSSVAQENGHAAPSTVAMGAGLGRPELLPTLAAKHHVTVIDGPPRRDELAREILMVADLAVLPCGPSAMDVWALAESLELVRKAQQVRPELRAAVLITRKQPSTSLGKGVRDALIATGFPVLKSELTYRVAYQEAPAAGMGPTTYAPNSPASAEVKALVAELERASR
jgi:chromosome partitioning protein